jgi:hypothetical protein
MNPINPYIQLDRHSGAGRNPVKNNSLRSRQNEPLAASFEVRPNQNVVPHSRGLVDHLDSGLRRNDVVFIMGNL